MKYKIRIILVIFLILILLFQNIPIFINVKASESNYKILMDFYHGGWDGYEGYKTISQLLSEEGYIVEKNFDKPLNMINLSKYNAILFTYPKKPPFNQDELNAIKEYVYNGGGLLLVVDTQMYWGDVAPNQIAGLFGVHFYGDFVMLAEIVNFDHPITKDKKQEDLFNPFILWDAVIDKYPSNATILVKATILIRAASTLSNIPNGTITSEKETQSTNHVAMIALNYGKGRAVFGPCNGLVQPWGTEWYKRDEPNKMLLNTVRWLILPDLTISEIKPVQVIWDCDINDDGKIDLVAGKSTMIRCKVKMLNYETLDKTTLVGIQLQISQYKTYNTEVTIEYLEKNNGIIDFYIEPPTSIGDLTILAKIDPENEIKEVDEANNEKSIEITVRDTRGLSIVYVRVESVWPATYGAPTYSEFYDTSINSWQFIKATYPVAINKITNVISYAPYPGTPIPFFGLTIDLVRLTLRKYKLGVGDKIIGIVSDDYFPYHRYPTWRGASCPELIKDAVLVTNGYWTTAAHEIAHTFGLNLQAEEYDVNPPGNPANGYWVEKHKEITNGICFMGYAPPKYTYNYWDGRDVWVCNETFENLFKEFIKIEEDKIYPDVLVIGGIVFKNGTINLTKWYYVENRKIEYPLPGNYSIITLDWNGKLIDKINFTVSFYLITEPHSIIETNVTGFVFPISFAKNIAMIKIQYNNITIFEINPYIKLLHDAIDCIPENAFVKDGIGRRKALHNKINEIEEKIMKNLIIDARNKLKFDLRDKLQKWLIDNYEITDPLQLSKNEILDLVDEIINRLNIKISQGS
ncbi:MAG: CARDB domain-containing protein [Candidatus Methanomethylicaceae archaeon]